MGTDWESPRMAEGRNNESKESVVETKEEKILEVYQRTNNLRTTIVTLAEKDELPE